VSRKKSYFTNILGVQNRIKEIRGGLTQKEFGKLIGVTQGTVQKYEKGECLPSEEVQEKIAAHAGVTVKWLLEGDKPELPGPEESMTIESPPPGTGVGLHDPYLFGRVDIGAMTQIIEMVEELLRPRKRPLKPVRFALLVSLLYDHFQTTGRIPDQATMNEVLRRVD
jgi:transcriptional regulator with XRE-family HTH domain